MPSEWTRRVFGDRQQQQVELLQRLGHLRQEAAGRPPLLRLEPRRRVGFVVVLVDQELFQLRGHLGQRQHRLLGSPAGTIAGQPREEHLRDAREEPLDLPPAAWPAHHGVDQADLEVGGHLFEVLGREVAAVVGIEDPGDAADLPARSALAPDRLPQRQGRLDRRRGRERQRVARHGTAVVVEDDGQPRLLGLATPVFEPDVQLGMVGLPDGVGRGRFVAVDQVERFG